MIHIRNILNSQYQCCHDPCDNYKQWEYGLMWFISASSQYQLIYLTACCRMITQNTLLYFWVARLRAGVMKNRRSSSARNKKFLPYPKCPDRPYDPPVVVIITITTNIIGATAWFQPWPPQWRFWTPFCSLPWFFPVVSYNVLTSSSTLPFHLVGDLPYLYCTIWICECYFWTILIKFFKPPVLYNVSIFQVQSV